MPDHVAAHFVERLADALRLPRRAQRGSEQPGIFRREVPARGRSCRHVGKSFKSKSFKDGFRRFGSRLFFLRPFSGRHYHPKFAKLT
jgi:hypothetical protein